MIVKAKCARCGNIRSLQDGRKKCVGCRRFEAAIKRGDVKGPEYTEVNTTNYKEPMEKVEGGFGYYGAITTTNDGTQIQCHICGYYFANVGMHVSLKHGVKGRDYKVKYGLRVHDGLLSPVLRVKMQKQYNESGMRRTPEEMAAMSRKGLKVRRDRGDTIGGSNGWIAQTRNEKGMCKDQTIAKIKHLSEKMGVQPTAQAFYREYGTGQADVIRHWFGTWTKAMKELGFKTYEEILAIQRAKRKTKALDDIYAFFQTNQRTPQYSDFKAIDWLPAPETVTGYYGSLNNARLLAGVPILVHVGGGHWVEEESA